MANEESNQTKDLPKLKDDGVNNNYGEWEIKSYHRLEQWDLLKFIEGPTSDPPFVPPLQLPTTHHGLNDENNLVTVRDLGNAIERDQAIQDAKPWMKGNKTALAHIVTAIPGHQLHLVKRAKYAKQAWRALQAIYQPRNSIRASSIRGQLMTYRCHADMNVAKWLLDMQRLYNSLCDLDPDRMSDHDYTLTILDLMPQNDGWRDFLSVLRAKVRDTETLGLPIDSVTFTTDIREEYWVRHKDDLQLASNVFSARQEYQKRTKRQHNADFVATSTSPTKRARTLNPEKAHLRCENPHCSSPRGHHTADCISYKGAKEGQYGDWWRGPWNLHLPKDQRTNDNNKPSKSHPAYARSQEPQINQSHLSDVSANRSSTSRIVSLDDDSQTNALLTPKPEFHVWTTQLDNNSAHITLPILNNALLRDNSCHYDSGANRHVFHDRSAFEDYKTTPPLTVKGFGQNLTAVAIGRGSIRLQNPSDKRIILLNNVLHIPAARSNLISCIQLDKAGVVSTLGNNAISLSVNNRIIVQGAIENDMYRLDLCILPPTATPPSLSLLSRVGPDGPALLSRIEPIAASVQVGSDFYTA
jgi:hypothetical protein